MTTFRWALLALVLLWLLSGVLIVRLFRTARYLDEADELELRRRARLRTALDKEDRA